MNNLATFDCISLRARGAKSQSAEEIQNVLPKVQFVPVAKKPAILKTLDQMQGAFILVLPPFVTPLSTLATKIPDPILLEAGYCLQWLSRNAISGALTAQAGPQFWRRAALMQHIEHTENSGLDSAQDAIILPDCQANWDINTSSGAAFSAGIRYVYQLQASDLVASLIDQEIHFAAVIGQDAKYADWWQLGVLNGILGQHNAQEYYRKEKEITARQGAMRQRIEDLLREVRNTKDLKLHYVTSKNSRFFKQNKHLMPAKHHYDALAKAYQSQGKAGAILADRYREAGEWVWAANSK